MDEKLEALIESFSKKTLTDFLYYKNLDVNERQIPQYDSDKFTDGEVLGDIDLPGTDRVGVFVFRVTSELSERSSRKDQYDKAKKILKDHNYDAGLFAFYDRKGSFRFSLVYPQYVGTRRIYNNFKRFTFFVSKDLSNKTFKQFIGNATFTSLDLIKESFSVSRITKEFFDSYRKLYLKLLAHIQKDDHFPGFAEKHGIHVEDVAKKLLGQIVFLYFLQRKGWLGAPQGEPITRGNSRFLRDLFSKAKEELARSAGGEANFFNDYLEYLFYDSLNNVPTRAASFFRERFQCQIPFLNGGLFEPTPDYKWRERFLRIPDEMFSNSKGSGILDVFDSFNFTIDENSADDQEVSVDPEMLGKVFENLLEENLRKGTGSYYTPREIVHYMVRDSLINVLVNKAKVPTTLIRSLFEEDEDGTSMSSKEAMAIDVAIKNTKVVDPACGSGAFIVALLQEMAHIRHLCKQQIQANPPSFYKIKKELIQSCIYGVDIDPGAVDIARLRLWLSLIVDQETDIDDITPLPNLDYKVMQGDSLLEDMYVGDLKIKIDIKTTSKVDRRTRQGKALKEGEVPHSNLTLGFYEDTGDRIADQLVRYHREFFEETDPSKKRALKDRIDTLENDLIFAGHDDALQNVETRLRNAKNNKEVTVLTKKKKEVKESLERWVRRGVRPFFPWRLHFAEVFAAGGFDVVIANPPYVGQKKHNRLFQITKNSNLGQRFHQRRMDYFYFFFHMGLDYIAPGGMLAYITTNYFFTATYADKLRQDIKERATVLKIVNFNELKIFKSALGQHNVITFLRKGSEPGAAVRTTMVLGKGIATSKDLEEIFSEDYEEAAYSTKDNESLFEGEDNYIRIKQDKYSDDTILDKVVAKGSKLKSHFDVIEGLHTGADKVSEAHRKKYDLANSKGEGIYVLSSEELSELKLNSEERKMVKRWYKNSNVRRWVPTANTNEHLLYYSSKRSYKNVETIKKHLEKFKVVLVNRKTRSGTGKISVEEYDQFVNGNKYISYVMNASAFKEGNYYCISYPREQEVFEGEKIVCPQRSLRNTFAYDDGSFYASADVYFIKPKDAEISLKYLLGLLNSRLYYYWLYNRGKRKGESLELYIRPLSEIPVAVVPATEQAAVIDLVNKIIGETKVCAGGADDITDKRKELEEELNRKVYEIYELTAEEIQVVDRAYEK